MDPVRRRRGLGPAASLLHLSATGLLIGGVLAAASLTPSLIPRDASMQGAICGAAFAVGYGGGALAETAYRWLELRPVGERAAGWLRLASALSAAGVLAAFLWRVTPWQNSIRERMGLPALEAANTATIALVAVAVALALFALAALFRLVVRLAAARLLTVMPPRVAFGVAVAVAATLFALVVNGVVLRASLRALDLSYRTLDAFMDPDTDPPSDPLKAGSAASLVGWDDLGRAGRAFVSNGPSADAIGAFTGRPAREPLRVYIGLNAADTADARAALALDELLRVGAFERSVLVVVVPTGTGFVDPASSDTLEYLHDGDVATVALQYSYLQSWLSIFVEPNYGRDTGRALFRAVYDHWTGLPADARPRLYLHGLSLGALSSEQSFEVFDIVGEPFDGALWSGPPFASPRWRTATEARVPGSPEWLPRFGDGSVLRFANQDAGLDLGGRPWGPMRLVYLQYASDPIVFFSPSLFFARPSWLDAPRGPDVSPAMRWVPIVTGLQVAADTTVSLNVPAGFGHQYAARDYIDAWIALTDPAGWTAEDVARLKQRFAR